MNRRIAECINILGDFCGKRDVDELTKEELKRIYGIDQADVMVLFGGSILCGGDVLARAIRQQAAKHYVIAGGAGHTTETLRAKVHQVCPEIETEGLPEAMVFAAYLKARYGLEADYLECCSTNCGNNITYLLKLLKEHQISFRSIILAQDASMQHRMEAGLRKYVPDDVIIINYAVYQAHVVIRDGKLVYENDIPGMWDIDRYLTLLLGEIPRLSDRTDGYGPLGKNYIAHVDIPARVTAAFEELHHTFRGMVREANPQYASRQE